MLVIEEVKTGGQGERSGYGGIEEGTVTTTVKTIIIIIIIIRGG